VKLVRRALVCAALAASAFTAHAQAAHAAGCTAEQYVDRVQQADADVRAGLSAGRVLDDVRSAERAEQTADAYLALVAQDLHASPPGLADARARLDALAGALALPRGSTCNVDSAPARSTLRSVYASSAFSQLDRQDQPSLLDGVLRAVSGWLSRVRGALGPAGGIAALAVLLLLSGALVWWRLRGSSHDARASPADLAELTDDPAAEWSLALAAATQGEYRQAVRRAFRSALLDVAWRGRMRIDIAWTTRELLDGASADGDLLALLAPAAAMFDRAWYSGSVVTAADWSLMKARCETLRRLATRRVA